MAFVAPTIAALLQVIAFSAIPFLTYLATRRKVRGFLAYVGLYRPESRSMLWATAFTAVFSPLMLWALSTPGLREMMLAPTSTTGLLRQMGPSASTVYMLVLYALVQTGLSEEILFRGFLARRLIDRFGFTAGNAVQAVIFALVHVALFKALAGQALTPLRLAVMLGPITLFGWLLGYIKERLGNGSTVPGWWAHGLGNLVAYTVVAFFWS